MNLFRVPVVRQILGAVTGASLALVLYGAYQYVSPVVTAYFLKPVQHYSGVRFAEVNDENSRRLDRIVSRTAEVRFHGAASQAETSPLDRVAEDAKNIQGGFTPEEQQNIIQALDQPPPALPVAEASSAAAPMAPPVAAAVVVPSVVLQEASSASIVSAEERTTQPERIQPSAKPSFRELASSGIDLWQWVVLAFVAAVSVALVRCVMIPHRDQGSVQVH
ncbi:MAG: hypothetical protein V1926_01420 [Candidatus Peregrinibacteria bacterium]